MGLRDALLALIGENPKYGYQLKLEFETACGDVWKVNPGQIYSTLQRLERDGFVVHADADDDGHIAYALTPLGLKEAAAWLTEPVDSPVADRDEMTMKILVAIATGTEPPFDLLDRQRETLLSNLATLTDQRDELGNDGSATALQLDRLILIQQAELRWLERAEDQIRRRSSP